VKLVILAAMQIFTGDPDCHVKANIASTKRSQIKGNKVGGKAEKA